MAELRSLRICCPPNKTAYKAGDRFERYGMEVKAVYPGDTEVALPFYDISPTRALRASDTAVTVSFMGFSVTQPIDVLEAGDEGYFPDACLKGAELPGNPAINAGDASVRYHCRPIKVGRDAYEVSLALAYSSRMTDRESDLIQGLPKGWRTNFHRMLVQDGRDGSGNQVYKYIDGDGYFHVLRYNPELGCHLDGDGCGLELNASTRVISDRNGNSMSFDAQGRVVSISETNGKTTVVEYNENGLRRVYDSRKPNDYIKLSYDAMSLLRWIRVCKGGVEKKIYDIIGTSGQITSVRESANGSSRELHMFSVNDRDRVNRAVDRLAGEAYRITYDFDVQLNDYIFSSVRKGHMESGSFVENEHGATIRNSRKMEGANPNLITELRIGVGDGLELQYGVDSMGRIALAFESMGSGRELRSLTPVVGDKVAHAGSFRIIVNGSTSDSFTGTLCVNSGLPSGAFGGARKLRLCGYVRLRAECSMARLSLSHLGSLSRKIEVNPHAKEAWQHFQIPFERVEGDDGKPAAFDSFEFHAEDQDGMPMLLAVADLRFMEPDDDPDVVFETAGGTVRMEKLSSIELIDSEGEANSVDVSGSEHVFGADELMMTLRRRMALGGSPKRVYLNGGEATMATYGGLTLVFSSGERIDVLDPSQSDNSSIGNGRNWYLARGDGLDSRAYFYFAEGSWLATYVTSRPFIGHPGHERLTSSHEYDYRDRLLEERNADGGGFRYEYFPEGGLMRKTAFSGDGEEIAVYEESREGDDVAVLEDGVASALRYDGDFLVEADVPGSNGHAKAVIDYDGYMEEATSITFFDGAVQASGNTVSSDDSGLRATVSDDLTSYKFEKSADGNAKKAFIMDDGGYADIFERTEQGSLRKSVFHNGAPEHNTKTIISSVDQYGNIHSIYDDYVMKVALSYETSGQSRSVDKPIYVSDSFSGRDTSIEYRPDGDVCAYSSGWLSVEYGDVPGEYLATMSFSSGDSFTLESNGEASMLSFDGGVAFRSEATRDGFGRIAGRHVYSNGTGVSQIYYYEAGRFSRPSGFAFGNSFGESYSTEQTSGRLSSKSSYFPMFMVSKAYYYDAFGRITREINSRSGLDRSYSYSGGRMAGFGSDQITYDGRGRIAGFGGISFEYDGFGNMILKSGPSGTLSCSYERGSMLASVQNVAAYEYDYEGKRTRKSKRNGNVHEYHYEGGRLIGEDITNASIQSENRRIRYFYDGQGIVGFSLLGASDPEGRQDFTYIRNPFNEIVGITRGDEVVAIYDYDAWGGLKVLNPDGSENNDPEFIGNVNPIRYKCYYYDAETRLYYLNSRYYDPEIGRFITADSYGYLNPTGIGGVDLYAYCNNDPVNHFDPNGHLVLSIVLLLVAVGAVVGGTVAGVNASNNGKQGSELIGEILTGAFVGGAIGGIIGCVTGPAIAGLLSSSATIGGAALSFAGIGGAAGGGIAVSALGELALAGVVAVAGMLSGITVMAVQWKPGSWPGDDPTVPPGDGFEWRGNEPIGGDKGAWFNPNTGDSLHPDLKHPQPIGPHWDWVNKVLEIFRRIFR